MFPFSGTSHNAGMVTAGLEMARFVGVPMGQGEAGLLRAASQRASSRPRLSAIVQCQKTTSAWTRGALKGKCSLKRPRCKRKAEIIQVSPNRKQRRHPVPLLLSGISTSSGELPTTASSPPPPHQLSYRPGNPRLRPVPRHPSVSLR